MKPLYTTIAFLLFASLNGCIKSDSAPGPSSPSSNLWPSDFPAMSFPADNPFSKTKAELGRYLFYDKRFSRDQSVSCASCHRQEYAFSDAGNALSRGFHGLTGQRNSPSLTNTGYSTSFFWDGTVLSLELQAIAPIINPVEMNMNTDTLVMILQKDPDYAPLFTAAWGDATVTLERITKSLSTFQRTVISGNAPFDRWNRGTADAISPSAQRGYDLFFGETGDCFHCHTSYNFTDNLFHNNGNEAHPVDEGRYRLTNQLSDLGKFRTPTLRNIALTAPYMHDGKFATLEEVLVHYSAGGKPGIYKDNLIRPLDLTPQQQSDIIAFLRSLTDSTFITNRTFADPWSN